MYLWKVEKWSEVERGFMRFHELIEWTIYHAMALQPIPLNCSSSTPCSYSSLHFLKFRVSCSNQTSQLDTPQRVKVANRPSFLHQIQVHQKWRDSEVAKFKFGIPLSAHMKKAHQILQVSLSLSLHCSFPSLSLSMLHLTSKMEGNAPFIFNLV